MHLRPPDVFDRPTTPTGSTPPGATGHDVQFYRTEPYLIRSVVDFLKRGVRVGQPLVVVATAEHWCAIENGLRNQGSDVEEALGSRDVVWLDARETLASFMVGPRPDPDRFLSLVGTVFEKLLRKRSYLIVRAYGEMVDLLWQDGNAEGAILLEALWNEFASKHAYSLLCGYSIDNFRQEVDADGFGFRRVCDHHNFTLPLEPHVDAIG